MSVALQQYSKLSKQLLLLSTSTNGDTAGGPVTITFNETSLLRARLQHEAQQYVCIRMHMRNQTFPGRLWACCASAAALNENTQVHMRVAHRGVKSE